MQLLTRKFTSEQYHKMAEVGIITESERVELIRGEILAMSPIGLKHAAYVKRLNKILSRKLGDRVIIGVQDPVQLNNNSEPQPDLSILKFHPDFYEFRVPQVEDIWFLIEVADTTIKYDREIKIPLYAANNIPQLWLIDVNNKTLEIYRQPNAKGYEIIEKIFSNQSFSPLSFSDIIITFEEIFII